MTIHKEGTQTIILSIIFLVIVGGLVREFLPALFPFAVVAAIVVFLLVLQFFRYPNRSISTADNGVILAPADGKVVVIEEAVENEYFKAKRLQVSIFMSPTNVHVNWNPIGGVVDYFKYHPGKYLVAWHPKSSTENERSTVVIDGGGYKVLLRQIAGAMARRIKTYVDEGKQVAQGSEMGFIKFGSRVDLYLPLNAKVEVNIGDKVTGNRTVIARVG